MTPKLRLPLLAAPLALLALAACDGASTGTAGEGEGRVAIRMGRPAGALQTSGTDQLVIPGDNGVLTLTDLRMVVAEFELKGDDDVNRCDDDGLGDDDCDDFESGPMFVDLPLGAGQTTVTSGDIRAGTYREIEFEVEDLDDDEDDASERAAIQALWQTIRAQFPDWPRDASLLVTGTFAPRTNGTLGAAVPFRVYIEAEIEVELPLSPPLVVTEGSASRTVTVTVDPVSIFKRGNNVLNLSQWNGGRIELETEVRDGFRSGRGDDGDDD